MRGEALRAVGGSGRPGGARFRATFVRPPTHERGPQAKGRDKGTVADGCSAAVATAEVGVEIELAEIAESEVLTLAQFRHRPTLGKRSQKSDQKGISLIPGRATDLRALSLYLRAMRCVS